MSHVDVVFYAGLPASSVMIILLEFTFLASVSCLLLNIAGLSVVLGFSLLVLLLFLMPIASNTAFSDISVFMGLTMSDSLSFWLSYLVVVVIFSSVLVVSYCNSIITFMFFLLLLCCYTVFAACDLFSLYLAYEFSLIPILYILVVGGSYPDRSLSAIYILVFTAVFSFPFMSYVLYSLLDIGSLSFLSFNAVSWGCSTYVMLFAFSTFLVKFPIYGLHFWLPIAHVEAPTYGSIILAGLLLKIGGCGLFRVVSFGGMDLFSSTLVSYFMVALLFSSLVCCVQSDFNRLVAYSSVAHMIVVVISLIMGYWSGFESFFIIMLMHGLSSPILFLVVGISYRLFGTRMLVFYRGILNTFPMLSLAFVISFVLSVPVPPSLAFLGELEFAISTIFFCNAFFSIVLIVVFFGVVYNLLWLNSLFGASSIISFSTYNFSITCREHISWAVLLAVSFLLILILN